MSFAQMANSLHLKSLEPMHTYTVAVALFDFLPVLVAACAMLLLAQAISTRHHALAPVVWLAAVLIPLGGLCKASWKLLVAAQGLHINWVENLLFILLAPGFIAMAFGLFHARRVCQAGISAGAAHYPPKRLFFWLALPLLSSLAAVIYLPESRLWFFCLLGITTLANVALLTQAILFCRWGGLNQAVIACFIYNFCATLALSGLARLPAGESTAWLQEGVNLSAQLALALGCWRLNHRMRQAD